MARGREDSDRDDEPWRGVEEGERVPELRGGQFRDQMGRRIDVNDLPPCMVQDNEDVEHAAGGRYGEQSEVHRVG